MNKFIAIPAKEKEHGWSVLRPDGNQLCANMGHEDAVSLAALLNAIDNAQDRLIALRFVAKPAPDCSGMLKLLEEDSGQWTAG